MLKRCAFLLTAFVLSLTLLISCSDNAENVDNNEPNNGGEETEISVSVTYMLFGGANPPNAPTEILLSNVSALGSIIPTLENYNFGGWFTDAALTLPLGENAVSSNSVTLYAMWTPKSYDVSFVLNGGKCDGLPSSYIYGEPIDLSDAVPVKRGYDFVSWYIDAALTEPLPTEPAGNIVLYAKFSPKRFAINYELSGGACEGLPTEYIYGVGADISDFVPTRKGYRFDGWYFDDDYNEEGNIIEDNFMADMYVYSKWIALPTKLSDIPDVKKGYFGVGGNFVEIDILDYVDPKGLELMYSVTSSNPTAVTASLSGSLLTLEFENESASAGVTVRAEYDGDNAIEFGFTAAAKAYKRIACVGDALTSGSYLLENEAYPTILAALLGEGFDVGNFGAGGTSVTDHTNSSEGDYAYGSYITYKSYHANSLAFDPDLVIIMLGTNDAKKWDKASLEYKEAYKALIKTYKDQNPDVDIVICTSPEVEENNSLGIPVGVISDHIYPMQLEIAAEVGATLIDFHAFFKSKPEAIRSRYYTDDGVRITYEAALELAALIKKTV